MLLSLLFYNLCSFPFTLTHSKTFTHTTHIDTHTHSHTHSYTHHTQTLTHTTHTLLHTPHTHTHKQKILYIEVDKYFITWLVLGIHALQRIRNKVKTFVVEDFYIWVCSDHLILRRQLTIILVLHIS